MLPRRQRQFVYEPDASWTIKTRRAILGHKSRPRVTTLARLAFHHTAMNPPSTNSSPPATKLLSPDAMNSTAFATSSG